MWVEMWKPDVCLIDRLKHKSTRDAAEVWQWRKAREVATARRERKRRDAACDKAAGWRRSGGEPGARGSASTAVRRGVGWGPRGARAPGLPASRRMPPASRPPTLLVLVCFAPLRAPHSCPDRDARRLSVAANATSKLPAKFLFSIYVHIIINVLICFCLDNTLPYPACLP